MPSRRPFPAPLAPPCPPRQQGQAPGLHLCRANMHTRQSWPDYCLGDERIFGAHNTVKARFWPWLSGARPSKFLSYSLFARQVRGRSSSRHAPAATGEDSRSTANMAHARQSRRDSGLGFQMKVFKTFSSVPSSLRDRGGRGFLPWFSGTRPYFH